MSQLSIYMQAVVPTARRLTAVTTALALVMGTWGYTPARAQVDPQPPQPQQPMQGAPQLTEAQLDQLVAPIALYPDNLLAQILSASTYPLEIVMAARWSKANPRVSGERLEAAMQSQSWDPSVKALCAVPQVLTMLSEKLEYTQQLGEAYLSQAEAIATAVQRLRARADASGNLKSSEQLRVRRVVAERPVAAIGPEYIVIEPVVPERIFVPIYDPFVAYGVWPWVDLRPWYWAPPWYVPVGGVVIGFGAAVFVGTALWATYSWGGPGFGRVFIGNPGLYASFNRVSITQAHALAAAPYKFDPAHRGNLQFKNTSLQTQFGSQLKTTNLGTNRTLLNNTNNLSTNKALLNNKINTGNIGNSGNTRINTGNTTTINKNVTINNNSTSNTANRFVNSGNNNTGNNKIKTFNNAAGNNTLSRSLSTGTGGTGPVPRNNSGSGGNKKGH